MEKHGQVLLVRQKGHQRVNALIDGIVRCHFLVEVQLRCRPAVPSLFFHYGDRGIIARRLDGQRHQTAARPPLRGRKDSRSDDGLECSASRSHASQVGKGLVSARRGVDAQFCITGGRVPSGLGPVTYWLAPEASSLTCQLAHLTSPESSPLIISTMRLTPDASPPHG